MLKIKEILKATGGKLITGKDSLVIKRVLIDSRSIQSGDLFIAIKGERLDGHKFIAQAIEKGAAAVIVSQKISCPDHVAVILVRDTTKALGEIAHFYRDKFSLPIIAITGSAGKTTTKEMIAAVLSCRFNVLKNFKTENNQFGVPLTLLKLNKSYDVAVVELGTNRFGDIPWLAKITNPTIAVFTNVGESHLERLKTPAGVFREKFQMVKFMPKSGRVIFNEDDRYLKKIAQKSIPQKKISYAINTAALCKASDVKRTERNQIEFKVKGRKFTLNTPFAHNVYNALAAISCGLIFKISLPQMVKTLSSFGFADGRQEIKKIGKLMLINDTYNSNPVSLRSAIDTLSSLKIDRRKILVCADMLELGQHSKRLHALIGENIAQSTIDAVFTMGPYAKDIHLGIRKFKNNIQTYHESNLEALNHRLKDFCQPGDVLLIKGSRGMHLEKTVEFLEKNFN